MAVSSNLIGFALAACLALVHVFTSRSRYVGRHRLPFDDALHHLYLLVWSEQLVHTGAFLLDDNFRHKVGFPVNDKKALKHDNDK